MLGKGEGSNCAPILICLSFFFFFFFPLSLILTSSHHSDLLETELGDAIRKQEKGYLQSLAHRQDKVSPSTITIVFVGGESSGIRDLFLACWNRFPVDDVMREKFEGVTEATGKEPLEKGKGSVDYDMFLVESTEGVEKMREVCSKAVIIVCAYSVYFVDSTEWIKDTFIGEAKAHFPNIPVMLVGTGTEARELKLPGVTSWTVEEGKKFSMNMQEECPSIRAHVECSPVTFQVLIFFCCRCCFL